MENEKGFESSNAEKNAKVSTAMASPRHQFIGFSLLSNFR